jgi:hypothetical protein
MFSKKSNEKASYLILKQIKDVESCLITFESFMRAAWHWQPKAILSEIYIKARESACSFGLFRIQHYQEKPL